MKKLIYSILTVAVFTTLGLNQAQACTVGPIDPVEEKNDLATHALTELKVSIEDLTSVALWKDHYRANYIHTRMCPAGFKSEATFIISFSSGDPLSKGCTAIVKVSKEWIYKNGQPKYAYDSIQKTACLE
ncbi:hypothetical protein K2X30_00430 [bacterium]|nr:hypothetical protein [bacterium]